MSSAKLSNLTHKDKAHNGRSSSSNGASGRKAPKAPPGAPINRLADPSMSPPADAIRKPGRNGKAASKAPTSAIARKDASYADKIQMVATDRFLPNNWNPNRMGKKKYKELLVEVKRSRTIAKPIIARPHPCEDKLEIIDGEHSWRAAKEAGLTEVPAVIEQMDDAEAMRQTYKRNKGGESGHDPLREGELFERRMKLLGLSIRGLAKQMDLDDKEIRNKLGYVDALRLRNSSAPTEEDRKKIAGLSIRKLEIYRKLPDGFRDRWLDNGCVMTVLRHQFVFDAPKEVISGKNLLERVASAGLIDLVRADNLMLSSFESVGKLALWCGDHLLVHDACDYVFPVGELKLPIKVLDSLPYEPAGEGPFRVMLMPEQWTAILRQATETTKDTKYRITLIQTAVGDALRAADLDPADALTHRELTMLEELNDAPDFIRNADYLGIEERHKLHRCSGYASDDLVHRAKEMTVEQFKGRRIGTPDEDVSPIAGGRGVVSVFKEHLERLNREQRQQDEGKLFSDRAALIEKITGCLAYDAAIEGQQIDGRPARDVLADDLATMSLPMLALLGGYTMHTSGCSAAQRWLEARQG